MYNEKVMEHFKKPKNMGEIKNPDAIGEVGNPKCLLPDEKIFLNGLFEPINSSRKKDSVISHKGIKTKIDNAFSKKYSGKIINLKNKLGALSLTSEHLIYALKVPKINQFLRHKNKKNLIPAWYHAEDLEKGDIVIYPIIKKIEDVEHLHFESIKKKYDFRSKPIIREIPLSNDLLRLFGYFISEGNIQEIITKTYVSFSLNIDETDIAEDISRTCKLLFNLDVKISKEPKKHLMKVYVYNVHFTRFLKELFGNGAENKKLPEFMLYLPPSKQKHLLIGLWKGDGCINLNRQGPRAGYSTTSYQLAQQIKILLLRQKIIPSYYVEKEKIIRGINHKKSYRIHVGQRESLTKLAAILGLHYAPKSYESIDSWFENSNLYTPITYKKEINYRGKVHNLEVNEYHSFISDAFCLHNCGDMMKVTMKINKKTKIIKDIKFKTFGCAAAIACSSVTTELIKGKTIYEAKKLTKQDVVKEFGELPAIKVHCSLLSTDAVKKAIADYEKKEK